MNSTFINFFLEDNNDEVDEFLRLIQTQSYRTEDDFLYRKIEEGILSYALKRSGKDHSVESSDTKSANVSSSSQPIGKKLKAMSKRQYLKKSKFKINKESNVEGDVDNFIDSDVDDEEIHKFLRSKQKRSLGKVLSAEVTDHKTRHNELRMREQFEDKSPDEFFESLRVTRRTYDIILEKLESENLFTKYSYGGNLAVRPKQALQMFLYYMSHRCTYKQLSRMFHISESAIMSSFIKCVEGINSMDDEEVKWPSFHHMNKIQSDFEAIAGMPGVVGSLGGCCIEMRTSKEPPAGYKIAKLRSIMYLLGVVDSNLRFIYIQAGFPGTFSLQEAFESSSLGEMMKESSHSLFPSEDTHLISNSDLTLQNYLLVPYASATDLESQQSLFNEKIVKTNVCDLAFKYLRGRFTTLHTQIYASLEKIPNIVKACCIIHNLALKDPEDKDFLLKNLVIKEEDYSIYRDDTEFVTMKPDPLALSKRDDIALGLK